MLHEADMRDPTGRRASARAALDALTARYCGGLSPGGSELIDRLFVNPGDGTGWLMGIGELSVSFRAGRPVTVRALSEVLQRRELDRELATRGLQWGLDLLQAVSACGSGSYAIPLFRELYESVYLRDPSEPSSPFRFGIATELGGGAPILKVYFDLHATQAERRRNTVERIARLLGETSGLEAWQQACPRINIETRRVMGVDFGAGGAVRSKFYWGARWLTWSDIAAAAREISGDHHAETVRHLERELTGVPDALSALMISTCGSNGERSMKLDLCVARLYGNDGEAYEAIERLFGRVMERAGPTPLRLLTGGLEPHRTKCVQQYLGVELPPGRGPRVTVYYRPLGFETEHLNPELRPRMCA